MKKARIISIVCIIACAAAFLWVYINSPDTLVLYKDRKWQADSVSKVVVSDGSLQTINGAIVPRKTGDYEASLSIFGIPYKSVKVKVLDDEAVIAGGQSVGIRLYSDGLVVVASGRISSTKKSPAEIAGIKKGDVITKLNGNKVGSPEEFSKQIALSEGAVTLEVKTEGKKKSVTVTPQASEYDNTKRIGVWVRDSTAGVGTLTYTDVETNSFGALGHAVSDVDTGVRFEVLKGSIEPCYIGGIEKGSSGSPGELKGVFKTDAAIIGTITKNVSEGIFGKLNYTPEGEKVKLGHKSEIKKGVAHIRTSLDGVNVKSYEIEILKVSPNTKNVSKGIMIKITDKELIEKTGGIVQGMSGSPIIQDGKLIGAVTHVLVNDPTKGYGIFIENMIEASKN